MTEREEIEQAIASLEEQRTILGDTVVDTSIAALRQKLISLEMTAPDAQALSEQQRKLITVLFADVSGYTAMSEDMDPEDLSGIMNALWSQIDKIIIDHGGVIDKHVGDAVMAIWGAENVSEDDPEWAIRAALAMQAVVRDLALDKPQSVPFKLRIGLNTGPVFLGEVGTTGEYTAMGDTVNVASRLEHAASVGDILISHDTYRHVRGVFDTFEREPLLVKGKEKPLRVYSVISAKERAFRLGGRGVAGIETQMVGREAEFKQLQESFRFCIDQRQLKLITIVGEAGIGKSRLIFEFENWLDLLPDSFWYFKGRANQQAEKDPYSLLRDLFAFRFEILDSDPIEIVREKMEVGFSQFVRDGSGMGQQAHMRAHILGKWIGYDFTDSLHLSTIGDDAEQLKNRGLLYLYQFFSEVAKSRPAIILLEDIHWADRPSFEALTDLLGHRIDVPLLVVALARPSLYEKWSNWDKWHSLLELHPLSKEDSKSLVTDILQRIDSIPEQLVNLIVNRSDGNPLYVEELIQMLIDDEVIVANEYGWEVQPVKLGMLDVPPTLTRVLQARLDRLPPPKKSTLQQASVVGRIFWDKAVDHMDQGYNVTPHLSDLQTKELIFRHRHSEFEGTKEYIFKHALLRDVAYETVLKKERQIFHNHVAEWLIGACELNDRIDEFAAIIAEHYNLAGEKQDARSWYAKAGRQAAARFAHTEALGYIDRALELIPQTDVAKYYKLLLVREEIYDLQGARSEQKRDLALLTSLADQMGVAEQAVVVRRNAIFSERTNNYHAAVKAAQQAVVLAEDVGDLEGVAEALRIWGVALIELSEYQEARLKFEEALVQARSAGDPRMEALSLQGLANVTSEMGDGAKATGYYERALEIQRNIDDRHGEAYSLRGLGGIFYDTGVYDRAHSYFENALKIQHDIGDRHGEGRTLNNLGNVAHGKGDNGGARDYYNQGLEIQLSISDLRGEMASLVNLGYLASDEGDYERALSHYQKAVDIQDDIGDRLGKCYTLVNLGLVYQQLGEHRKAESYARQALDLSREIGSKWIEGYALTVLGNSLAGQDQVDSAIKAYNQSIVMRREADQPTRERNLLLD